MNHTTQSANTNNIVGQLGIQGVGFGGPGAWGAPYFNVQGYSPFGDTYARHADARLGHGDRRPRHTELADGSPQPEVRRQPTSGTSGRCGASSRTAATISSPTDSPHRRATNDGTGSALASFLLGLPAVRQRQAGVPQMNLRQWYADGFAQDKWRVTATTTLDFGLRYEYMSPLSDVTLHQQQPDLQQRHTVAFIGGQNGYPRGLMYPQQAELRAASGHRANLPDIGPGAACRIRHLLHAGGHEHLVQPAPQRSLRLPGNERRATISRPPHREFQLRAIRCWARPWSASPPWICMPRRNTSSSGAHRSKRALGKETTLEIGYLGSGGFHLQRAHLINNAHPGPGADPAAPALSSASGLSPETVFPPTVTGRQSGQSSVTR